MSETPSVPVETATGTSVNAAVEGAANDADKHTPETPVVPPADAPDATNADKGKSELETLVADLATQVATLTNLVTKAATPDEGAGEKLPWALRGKKEL